MPSLAVRPFRIVIAGSKLLAKIVDTETGSATLEKTPNHDVGR